MIGRLAPVNWPRGQRTADNPISPAVWHARPDPSAAQRGPRPSGWRRMARPGGRRCGGRRAVRPRVLVPRDPRGRTAAEVRAPGAVNRSAGRLPGRSWPGSWQFDSALTTSFGLVSSVLTSANVDWALPCWQPPSNHDCPCVAMVGRSLSHADRTPCLRAL